MTTSARDAAHTADAAPENLRVESQEDGGEIMFARFGSFLIVADRFVQTNEEIYHGIADALSEDPRVTRVRHSRVFDPAWCRRSPILPAGASEEDLITGEDVRATIKFSAPISFFVDVPAKNQPKRSAYDELPTEYEVLWDGQLALVTWHGDPDSSVPMSGGHIVIDILKQAACRAGFDLYVQACSPHCDHGFAHTDLILVAGGAGGDDIEYTDSRWEGDVEVQIPDTENEVATDVFVDICVASLRFTELKNLSQRLLELEITCRRSLDSVMGTYYSRAQLPLQPVREQLAARWSTRDWRRTARRDIARIWLILAQLEKLIASIELAG